MISTPLDDGGSNERLSLRPRPHAHNVQYSSCYNPGPRSKTMPGTSRISFVLPSVLRIYGFHDDVASDVDSHALVLVGLSRHDRELKRSSSSFKSRSAKLQQRSR